MDHPRYFTICVEPCRCHVSHTISGCNPLISFSLIGLIQIQYLLRWLLAAFGWGITLLVLIPAVTHARTPESSIENARSLNLAADPEWLALLHYEARWGEDKYRSYVDDGDFFLAENGATSPEHELEATLTAFFEQPDTQCKFIARRQWLESALESSGTFPERTDCAEYQKWRNFLGTRQVVLVFASSYLNSPSSMYGHTFLRFDSENTTMDSPLLSYALNFGANIPPNENGLIYAYRGLLGGYPGQFSASPYFEKLKSYSRIENRDLWEYRLNLTAGEIDRLLEHIWELREINFDYYFFDENCSLRLLELLDVARPGVAMTPQFSYAAIPVDTVRSVINKGMVLDVAYRPANQTKLKFQITQLTKEQQQLALALSEDIEVLEGSIFDALIKQEKIQVAQAAYDYLRYSATKKERAPNIAKQRYALLAYISKTTYPTFTESTPPRPVQPDTGHDTMLLSIAAGIEDDNVFSDFEWRISYHDLLDAEEGYPGGASLNMARIVARARENNSLQLQRFDAIEITSLSSRTKFFKPISWRVDFGAERQWTKGDDSLVGQVNGGVGLTWSPVENSQLFGMVTGRLEYNPDLDRKLDIAAGVSLGFRIVTNWGNTLIDTNYYHFTDDVDRTLLGIAHNLPLNRNNALRFKLSRRINHSNDITDTLNEVSLAYRHYF